MWPYLCKLMIDDSCFESIAIEMAEFASEHWTPEEGGSDTPGLGHMSHW